jgi:hypothetical protein
MVPTHVRAVIFIDEDGIALDAYPWVSRLAALSGVFGGHARGRAAEVFRAGCVGGSFFELQEAGEVAQSAGFDALVVAEGEEDGADEGLGGLGEVVEAGLAWGCEGWRAAAPGTRGCWLAHL